MKIKQEWIATNSVVSVDTEFLIRIAVLVLLMEYAEAVRFLVFQPSVKENKCSEYVFSNDLVRVRYVWGGENFGSKQSWRFMLEYDNTMERPIEL